MLVFKNVAKDDLTFTREGDDLLITIDGYQGETTLSSFFHGKQNMIEELFDSTLNSSSDTGYDLTDLKKLMKYSGDSFDGSDLWT
jgi:hypothetical protein